MADSVPIPRLLLQIATPILIGAVMSVFGWFLSQLYNDFHTLSIQVQDVDRTQSSVVSRQSVLFERVDKRDNECAAHNREIDRRFEVIGEKIAAVRTEIDARAADRFTGKEGRNLQEVLGVQIGFLWDGLNDLRNDVKELHDALRAEYTWDGRR